MLTRLHTLTLWREDGSVICSAICEWLESPRNHNHTLLSHLRLLGSLSVACYDSQGLRWKYSTLWREDGSVICCAICEWSESRRTHNHTLLSHLRLLGSLSVVSYDSQGLRWKYSYPPPHGEYRPICLWEVRTILQGKQAERDTETIVFMILVHVMSHSRWISSFGFPCQFSLNPLIHTHWAANHEALYSENNVRTIKQPTSDKQTFITLNIYTYFSSSATSAGL
jgi:hypothetical protein